MARIAGRCCGAGRNWITPGEAGAAAMAPRPAAWGLRWAWHWRPRPRILASNSFRNGLSTPAPVRAPGLGMKSAAPRRNACNAIAAPRVVTLDDISTRMAGSAASRRGRAVSPSITGISISSTTTSTPPARTAWSASRPLAVLATIWIAGWPANSRSSTVRATRLSSHSSTRVRPASFREAAGCKVLPKAAIVIVACCADIVTRHAS